MRLHTLPVIVTLLLASVPARADGGPPDIVRKKDGGILRGTIDEMDPKGEVKITLASGEKRAIPMTEVQCAGPLAECQAAGGGVPPASPPSPSSPPPGPGVGPTPVTPPVVRPFTGEDRVKLQLVHHDEPVTVYANVWHKPENGHVAKNDDPLTAVCTTPCVAEIPRGTYRLWMSKDNSPPAAEVPRDIQHDAKLEVDVDNHLGRKIAGWVVFGASLSTGGSLVLYGLFVDTCDLNGCSKDSTAALVGAAIAVVGGGVGLGLALSGPTGTVRVLPGLTARTWTRGGEGSSFAPGGSTLSVRF